MSLGESNQQEIVVNSKPTIIGVNRDEYGIECGVFLKNSVFTREKNIYCKITVIKRPQTSYSRESLLRSIRQLLEALFGSYSSLMYEIVQNVYANSICGAEEPNKIDWAERTVKVR